MTLSSNLKHLSYNYRCIFLGVTAILPAYSDASKYLSQIPKMFTYCHNRTLDRSTDAMANLEKNNILSKTKNSYLAKIRSNNSPPSHNLQVHVLEKHVKPSMRALALYNNGKLSRKRTCPAKNTRCTYSITIYT